MMFPVTGWAVRVPMVDSGNNGSTGELSVPLAVMGLHIKAPTAQKGEAQTAKITAVLVIDLEKHMQLLAFHNGMEFSQMVQPVVPIQQGAQEPQEPAKPEIIVATDLPRGL